VKAGISSWNQRIAPVFDVSREMLVVEIESGRIVGHSRQELPRESGWYKVDRLNKLSIDTLICGAISRPMQELITAQGIKVHSFIAGNIEEVKEAWLHDRLVEKRFAMPGCGHGRKRRRCGGRFDQRFKL